MLLTFKMQKYGILIEIAKLTKGVEENGDTSIYKF